MPSRIGIKANQLVETSYTSADIATSFAAVTIDTTLTRSLTVFSIDAFALFDTLADRNNLIQQRVVIYRDLRQLVDGVALASQVGNAERVWGGASGQLSFERDFAKPLSLRPGNNYVIALYPVDLNAALAGTVRVGLVVTADLLPAVGVERIDVPKPVIDVGRMPLM